MGFPAVKFRSVSEEMTSAALWLTSHFEARCCLGKGRSAEIRGMQRETGWGGGRGKKPL